MMGKQIHPRYLEEGMKFTKLTVIETDVTSKIRNGKIMSPLDWKYKCRCDCGREVSVLRWSLIKKTKTSCGCDSFKDPQYLQEGEVYSNWKVLGLIENFNLDSNGVEVLPNRWKYYCTCIDCGRTKVITKHGLFKEVKPPCICESLLPTGTIYGRLTVIGLDEEYNKNKPFGNWKYMCKCSCVLGNTISLTKQRLNSGNTRSCGCLLSEHAKKRKRDINPIEDCGDYIKIFFFNNESKYTIIDKEDYDKVKHYCWSYRYVSKTNLEYAVSETNARKLGYSEKMHRIITNCPEDLFPDHKDGDGLNNRKVNLRTVTKAQNNINKRIRSNNVSGVTGVWWMKSRRRWVAELKINGKCYTRYKRTKEDAIKARKELEEKYFGEFSYDNSRGIDG